MRSPTSNRSDAAFSARKRRARARKMWPRCISLCYRQKMAVPTRSLPHWRGLALTLAPLALLFVVLMSAGAVLTPPPLRADNRPDQFNAPAAHERLVRILGDETPHPVDSAAQDRVRVRLMREIAALGFAPEVRERFACRAQPRSALIDCALVRNIVFSAGPESGPAVLTATHYDTVPAAPGASDAGAGIAAWLEVARLLREQHLARRVIFLFSDGEEPALLGAHAFAQSDPLMRDVEAVVNLEARGTRGPAIFFESNQPNADAVAAFAHAPRGVANSVMADVYALLQNSTDVTALRRPGLDIVNIALLDGFEDYHTPQDSLASFNARSLQHMGDVALATTRAFAGRQDRGAATPMIYTDIASYAFVSAPSWAGQAALALCALIAFAAFWRAGADARWRAFAVPPLALALAALLAAAIGFVLSLLRLGQDYWFAHPEPTRAWCALSALLAIVLSLWLLRGGERSAQAGAAGAFWFAAIGFAASLTLPGVSILFALPVLFYAAGTLVALAWPTARAIGAAAAGIVALLIWAPTLYLVELALGYGFAFATALLTALMSLTWLGAIAAAGRAQQWRTVALALAASAAVAGVAAAFAPGATAVRPRPLNIVHFFDASSGEGYMLAGPARRPLPSELARSYTFAPNLILPGDRFPTWAARADAPAPAFPALAGLRVDEIDGEHVVRARLITNGAYRVTLRMPRTDAPVRARVNDAEALFADVGGAESDYLNLACQGRACDGAEIVIATPAPPALHEWVLIAQQPGARTVAASAAIARRPASATPIQFGDGVLMLAPAAP